MSISTKSDIAVAVRESSANDELLADHLPNAAIAVDPLKLWVARLSLETLEAMPRNDLARVIRWSGAFASQEWISFVECLDHSDLDRLAYLAYRHCRSEINAVYELNGRQWPFSDELD